jgi:hypothetical protein
MINNTKEALSRVVVSVEMPMRPVAAEVELDRIAPVG